MKIPSKSKGFTLIELLIALTVFAILATLTSSSLYYAFNTRARVNAQADRLNHLQIAMSLIQQDTLQATQRAIRGNNMHLFPIFVGQSQYLEFTRAGNFNPKSYEKRSTLKRVALLCNDKTLIRRTWPVLDPINRSTHRDKILIDNIESCHFNFLNRNLQLLSEWQAQAVDTNQNTEPFPKAIQLNMTIKEWGEMNMLFIIPEGLYVSY